MDTDMTSDINIKYVEHVILERLRGNLGTGAFEKKVEQIQKQYGFAETVLAFNQVLRYNLNSNIRLSQLFTM